MSEPSLRIVRGEPDPTDVAAVVIALAAVRARHVPGRPAASSGWADRRRLLTQPPSRARDWGRQL